MIHVLDQKTIDKIAAGEVIERPASVVKELVENSIDAGATRITVEVKDGGTTLIRVTDNGQGIAPEEVRTAFLSHATSKLENADDLFGIGTLGFRGEALSTIAAVTETEMITKTRDSVAGTKYVIRGGTEVELSEVGAPDGTTIIARNLFYNTPARQKFLKSNMTEGSYITDLMSHIALQSPEVAIRLISNDKTLISTAGDNRLKETIHALYGSDITKSILPVEYESGGIRVTGFIGKPFLSKGNRSFENYFINKRYIKSAVINRAIEEAYKTYVMQHRFPFTVIFLDMDPKSIDVNVHPAKREFRCDNEKELFSAVFHAVHETLKKDELIPDYDADYKQKEKIYTPLRETSVNSSYVRTASDARYNSDKSVIKNPVASGSKSGFSILESILPEEYRKKLSESVKSDASSVSNNVKSDTSSKDIIVKSNTYSADNAVKQDTSSLGDFVKESAPALIGNEPAIQQTFFEEDKYLSQKAAEKHRIIGQVFKTYWISEYNGELYIMDQHAAHEKVNYETFLKEFKNRNIVSQNLFPPVMITLSAKEKLAVMGNLSYFEKSGFEVEDFGGNEIKLSSVPINLIGLSGRDIFMEFAAYLADGLNGILTEDIFVRKLATMGCKAAIKGNQEISLSEAEVLIDRLMTLDNPYTCPHGRPTIVRMTKDELDKKFRRIVE